MKIVNRDTMRKIEAQSELYGVSNDALMENAGLAVARRVRHHVGHLLGVKVTVLVGPGNNGGDGLVIARHLGRWGANVGVYLCGDRRISDPKLSVSEDLDFRVSKISGGEDICFLKKDLSVSHVVVDAVLGAGLVQRPIVGVLKEVFAALSDSCTKKRALIVAVDLPSGMNADSGEVDPMSPTVDVTVALGYAKIGHFEFPGSQIIGELEVVDIGVPFGVDDDVSTTLMTSQWAESQLPDRPSTAHKGTFGRAMVVAGSSNYIGAAYLAAAGAARAGAGLVTLAMPSSLQTTVAGKFQEATYLPLPEITTGSLKPGASKVITDRLPEYQALLIGCGIGQSPGAVNLVREVLLADLPPIPTIIDADALNILSRNDSSIWWKRLSDKAIVTPHLGEMARLTGSTVRDINANRSEVATSSAIEWNKVVVLKGPNTLIAFPDGNTLVSPFANAVLASAGTGDVLSGLIAGLLAQGTSPELAAALGVFVHGAAGDAVCRKIGNRGMIASDLLGVLPTTMANLSNVPIPITHI